MGLPRVTTRYFHCPLVGNRQQSCDQDSGPPFPPPPYDANVDFPTHNLLMSCWIVCKTVLELM